MKKENAVKKVLAGLFILVVFAVLLPAIQVNAGMHADPQYMTWICGQDNNVPLSLSDGKSTFSGVTYYSLDESLIHVTNKTGRLGIEEGPKTKRSGTTKIMLVYNGQKYYCTIKKIDPKMSKTKLKLVLGEKSSQTLTMSNITGIDGKKLPLVWNSTNQAVAIVKDGKVTAMKPGKTTITCTVDGRVTYECKVEVTKNKVTSISLDQTELTLAKEQEAALKAVITPNKAANKQVRWSTSDKLIATVDEKGVITTHKAGTVTITVQSVDNPKVTATCVVTVTE